MGSRSLIARAVLCVALWAGLWVLAAALVLGLAAIPLAQERFQGGVEPSGVVAGIGAAVVAWALRPRWRRARRGPRPPALAPKEHPALHALVARVAAAAGVAPPHEVRIGPRLNASIGAEPRWLGLRRRRVLELGLPLVLALDEDEVAAVIAHELAHQRGGDVALGAWVYRTRAALGDALEGLDGSAFWLDLPFRAYGWLFLRVSASVSRAQELAADACGAAIAGRAAAYRALSRIDALGASWDVYLDLVAIPLVDLGVRVALHEGFARFLAEPARAAEVERALAAAGGEPPSPLDTHPATADRLRAIDPGQPPPGVPPGSGCAHLLGGVAAAEAAWYARFTQGALRAVGWDDVAREAILPALARAHAGTPLDPARFDPGAIPALVRDPGPLSRALLRGVSLLSPAAHERAGRRAVGEALAVALARRGFRPELRPGGELTLRRGALTVVPARVVAQLAEGSLDGAGYRADCAAWEAAPPSR